MVLRRRGVNKVGVNRVPEYQASGVIPIEGRRGRSGREAEATRTS